MRYKILFFTILVWASLVGFAQESTSSVQKRSLPLTTRFKDCEEAITSLTKELHECDSLLALQPDSRPLIIERAICCNLLAEYHLEDLHQKDAKEAYDTYIARFPEDSVQLDEEPEHDLSYYYQQIIGYYQQSLQHAEVLQSEPIAPYREYITYRWLGFFVLEEFGGHILQEKFHGLGAARLLVVVFLFQLGNEGILALVGTAVTRDAVDQRIAGVFIQNERFDVHHTHDVPAVLGCNGLRKFTILKREDRLHEVALTTVGSERFLQTTRYGHVIIFWRTLPGSRWTSTRCDWC